MKDNLENHLYANMFPLLDGEEFDQLVADIKDNGLVYPITLFEDKVLDGRNRYQACLQANVEPRFKEFDGNDPISFVISSNSSRRDLTASQRACAAVNATQLINRLRREAKERQGTRNDIVPTLAQSSDSGRTREILAKRFKVSHGYIDDAFAIKALRQQITRLIEDGTPSKLTKEHSLWRELGEKNEGLKNLFNEVFTGKKGISEAKRQQVRFEHDKKVTQADIDKLDVPHLVLADPPWKYDFSETNNRKIENQYGTLTIDEIKAKSPITTPDAVLFLWATQPKLREALDVMDVWGFEYKSGAVWDKGSMGMGYWFRGQHELLLVGTRGKFSPPNEFLRVSSVFKGKAIGHSTKPNQVYEWIEKAFPECRKLEMFARKVRKGWQAEGDEV